MWWLRCLRFGYRYWGRHQQGAVKAYLQVPLPNVGRLASQSQFCVIDIETTGLCAKTDQILSIAWVMIEAGHIDMSTARHHLVQSERDVGQSATIHFIRDCDLDVAQPLPLVLASLLEAIQGKTLVFHNASLDTRFLNKALSRHYQTRLLQPVVDTLWLERQLYMRRNQAIESGVLRLDACRKRYGLPRYTAHNALSDALATAELLLAIISRKNKHRCTLRQLLFQQLG